MRPARQPAREESENSKGVILVAYAIFAWATVTGTLGAGVETRAIIVGFLARDCFERDRSRRREQHADDGGMMGSEGASAIFGAERRLPPTE
jgi:hypothetical protein